MEQEIVKISMLLEIYGELLTDKQYTAINQYYNEDFSLAEIAEEQNISRQAVRDNISAAKEKLYSYESKLKLYEKKLKQDNIIDECLKEMTNLNCDDLNLSDKNKIIKEITNRLKSLK